MYNKIIDGKQITVVQYLEHLHVACDWDKFCLSHLIVLLRIIAPCMPSKTSCTYAVKDKSCD